MLPVLMCPEINEQTLVLKAIRGPFHAVEIQTAASVRQRAVARCCLADTLVEAQVRSEVCYLLIDTINPHASDTGWIHIAFLKRGSTLTVNVTILKHIDLIGAKSILLGSGKYILVWQYEYE